MSTYASTHRNASALAATAELNARAVASVHSLLQSSGQLAAGALLIRNPYEPDSYEMSEDAIESFSVAKYHAFANVSRMLGAKQVRFLEAKAESQDESWQAKIAAILPAGSGDAEAVRDVAKKLDDRLSGHLTFEGGAPDPEAAREYLRRSYLTHDPAAAITRRDA